METELSNYLRLDGGMLRASINLGEFEVAGSKNLSQNSSLFTIAYAKRTFWN